VAFSELRELRAAVRRIDPQRLVTASHAGDISREELRDYIKTVEVDFVCPHRPRHSKSPSETQQKTQQLLAWMKELGRELPVHYQEPFRRGFSDRWNPTAADFGTDLRQAISGGAAGWCFHNGDQRDRPDGQPRRSFDLRSGGLFDQLDAEERSFCTSMSAVGDFARTTENAQRSDKAPQATPTGRFTIDPPMNSHGILKKRLTEVSIQGDAFLINGTPTYRGRTWRGNRIEGLLFNSRMVQGIFDDLNAQTVGRWAYPDTGRWDADRNTRELVAAMPEWRKHGLLAFTINLQGGSPEGYSKYQPWHNSAIHADGTLRPAYMARLEKILDQADALGMAVILGIFYFGQDERLRDEAAVVQAVDAAVDWILDRGYRNVLVEINNECNVAYDHAVLQPARVHELIDRVKCRSSRNARRPRLLASTSYGGGTIPRENVVRAADFLLIHGNGVDRPEHIAQMVRECRRVPGYRPMPILFNEDDHFDFDKPQNNMLAAVGANASWGYFDPGKSNYRDGYQSPPVNWRINTPRKIDFFALVHQLTRE